MIIFCALLVLTKKVYTSRKPQTAVVPYSPQKSGAGCADGFEAKHTRTTP